MSNLFVRDGGEWAVTAMVADYIALNGPRPLSVSAERAAALAGAPLVSRVPNGARDAWILTSRRWGAVMINGVPLTTGVRVLLDRDEIRVRGAGTYFYSTERLASVETFSGSDRPVMCPRCKLEIERGDPSVRCPRCLVLHHEKPEAELNCWSYDSYCAMCAQSTDLKSGFQWAPDRLEGGTRER